MKPASKKPAFTFTYSKQQLVPTNEAAVNPIVNTLNGKPSSDGEDNLKFLGYQNTVGLLKPKYQWPRMGGWEPSCRASIVRVVTFKMFGTGIACAIMANHPRVGRWTGHSCALCAAVNLVAGFHYLLIWAVRAQVLPDSYSNWKVRIGGRAQIGDESAEREKLVDSAEKHQAQVIFAQEAMVDGLRHTDWACTLVLMTMDLAHFREWIFVAHGRGDRNADGCFEGEDLQVDVPWLCLFQGLMVTFGSAYRFYFNEGRSPHTRTKLAALLCWIVSATFFGIIVWQLWKGVPPPGCYHTTDPVHTRDDADLDVLFYRFFFLIWIGYPAVSLLSRWQLRNVDYAEYNADVSMLKDLTYGTLDGLSKAGMAFYFLAKSSRYSEYDEMAMICNTGTLPLPNGCDQLASTVFPPN